MEKGKIMEKKEIIEQGNFMEKEKMYVKTYNFKDYNKVIFKVMELQDIILQKLEKEEKKDYLLEKKEEEYKNIFENKDAIFVCAFDGDKLIATTMTKPSPDDHKPEKIKEGKLKDFTMLECSNGMVHPEYQGKGLLSKLLEKIIVHYEKIEQYEKAEKKFLLTGEIVYSNGSSLVSVLKNGFAIDHAAKSKIDGAEVVYLWHAVNNSFDENLLKDGTSIKELTKEEIKNKGENKKFEFYEKANELMVLKQEMPQQMVI